MRRLESQLAIFVACRGNKMSYDRKATAERAERNKKIIEMHEEGFTKRAIAESVGLSYAGVWDILKAAGADTGRVDSTPAKERFERNIRITPGCWLWTASIKQRGYGSFSIGYQNILAHRFSYEIYCGPIPPNMMVLHSCDNPRCVNPDHLRVGTHAENMQDMVDRERCSSGPGEKCPSHKLTEAQAIAIYNDPRPQKIIASEYGVVPSTVSQIKSKRLWPHIHK